MSLVAGAALRQSERQAAAQLMDKRVATVRDAVTAEARRYVDALQLVAGGLSASPELTMNVFLASTAPLRQLNLRGATARDVPGARCPPAKSRRPCRRTGERAASAGPHTPAGRA